MTPSRKRVVVVGCGFGGAAAVRTLAREAGRDVELIAFNRTPTLYNYPILPRLLVEDIPHEQVAIPLSRVFEGLPLDLRIEVVEAIRPDRRLVETASGPVPYDYLILAVGSRSIPIPRGENSFVYFPKASRHLERLRGEIDTMAAELAQHPDGPPPRVAVIGGGLTGVEFAACVQEAITWQLQRRHLPAARVVVDVYEQRERLAPQCSPAFSAYLAQRLQRAGIGVHLRREVTWVEGRHLTVDGEALEARAIIACRGSAPDLRLGIEGLGDTTGGIPVNAYLQSVTSPFVFAVGDSSRPLDAALAAHNFKQAAHALAQGRHAARNVLRHAAGQPLLRFRPANLPVAVTLGARAAALAYGSWHFEGRWIGRLKRFRELHYF
jgi:NADH:ubiquinone reductase (H+-translocating)